MILHLPTLVPLDTAMQYDRSDCRTEGLFSGASFLPFNLVLTLDC